MDRVPWLPGPVFFLFSPPNRVGGIMARVVLAMSGGVDSSVAAHLLLEQGHDVVGLFMRHGHTVEPDCQASDATSSLLPLAEPTSNKQGCCSASDAVDARRVADQMDIPFYALDFEEEFDRIIDYFVDEYTQGRTPNPCVMCNNWLKFGRLCHYADSVGAEYVASGHYARLVSAPGANGPPALFRGRDAGKDQSYVLFGIQRDILSRMLLPVGDYTKPQIRELAHKIGLRVADKRDSQEICFVGRDKYAAFVQSRLDEADRGGEIVMTDGTVVGHHDGIERFTIGQRKGLGVALGEPRFVVRIEPTARRVVIGERHELGRRELTAARSNWLIDPPTQPLECTVKIRYLSTPAAALVEPLDDNRFAVRFKEPKNGVAPGQAVVCYDKDQVLGGGWIE